MYIFFKRKKSDIEAALNGIAQNPETDTADHIAELKNKYDILKVQLAETPDDAAVNAELNVRKLFNLLFLKRMVIEC